MIYINPEVKLDPNLLDRRSNHSLVFLPNRMLDREDLVIEVCKHAIMRL